MVAHCADVLRPKLGERTRSGIVAGCGTGDEVVYLRRAFDIRNVFGVDVDARFSSLAHAEGCVAQGDALRLPFPADAFGFAAAFHSLEHVGDARKAVEEIRRVLEPGAWFYLGVPNRTRLLGYIGSFDASTWQKITWNLADWRARLGGKFRNEMGAHAGFDRNELLSLLNGRFCDVRLLTEEFLRYKYAGRIPAPILNALLSPALIDYAAPSHYAICRK